MTAVIGDCNGVTTRTLMSVIGVTCAGGQDANDVRMTQADDVAFCTKALRPRQYVLDASVELLDGDEAVAENAEVDGPKAAAADLLLETNL